MPYNWENYQQQQLAGPQNNTGMNAVATMQQPQQQKMSARQQYPNATFPRLRRAWEGTKKGGGNFLFGQPEGIEQVQNYTPQQQGIMQLLQQLGIYGLQNPYEGFEDISNQAHNEFNQQTVPNLAESFTRMTNGAMSSPSFASQLGQAGAGLSGDLAAQKAQYGQQNMQQILQMLQMGLHPQFENLHRPQSNGLVQNALLGGIQAAPSIYQSRQIGKAVDALTKGAKG